jgi:hypothetical protein
MQAIGVFKVPSLIKNVVNVLKSYEHLANKWLTVSSTGLHCIHPTFQTHKTADIFSSNKYKKWNLAPIHQLLVKVRALCAILSMKSSVVKEQHSVGLLYYSGRNMKRCSEM